MKRRKNIGKRGDAAVFALLTIPTLMLIFYGTFTINSCVDFVDARTQSALDASLFYLSSKGQSSQIIVDIDDGGNPTYKTICTMSENVLVSETLNYVCPYLVEKINGFNKHWEVWLTYRNNSNYQLPDYYVFKKVELTGSGHEFDDGWRVGCTVKQKGSDLRSYEKIGSKKYDEGILFPDPEEEEPSRTTMSIYENDHGLTYNGVSEVQIYDTLSLFIVGKVPQYNIDNYDKYFKKNPNWEPGNFTATITAYGTSQCRGA